MLLVVLYVNISIFNLDNYFIFRFFSVEGGSKKGFLYYGIFVR